MNSMYYSNHGAVHKGDGWALAINEIEARPCAMIESFMHRIPVMATFEGAGDFVRSRYL